MGEPMPALAGQSVRVVLLLASSAGVCVCSANPLLLGGGGLTGWQRRGHAHQGDLSAAEQAALAFVRTPATPRGDTRHESVLGSASVAVRSSGIRGAGRGAFALRAFAEGELIARFNCLVVARGFSELAYGWDLNATHACDSQGLPLHNPMRYVNSVATRETCDTQNVVAKSPGRDAGILYYVRSGRARRPSLRASHCVARLV